MLDKRGSAVIAGKSDKARKIEKEIEDYVKDNFEKL